MPSFCEWTAWTTSKHASRNGVLNFYSNFLIISPIDYEAFILTSINILNTLTGVSFKFFCNVFSSSSSENRLVSSSSSTSLLGFTWRIKLTACSLLSRSKWFVPNKYTLLCAGPVSLMSGALEDWLGDLEVNGFSFLLKKCFFFLFKK